MTEQHEQTPRGLGTLEDLYNIVGVTPEDKQVRSVLAATQSLVDYARTRRLTFREQDDETAFVTRVLRAYGVTGPVEADYFVATPVKPIQLPEKLWERLISYSDMSKDPGRLSEIPQGIAEAAGL